MPKLQFYVATKQLVSVYAILVDGGVKHCWRQCTVFLFAETKYPISNLSREGFMV